MVNVANAAAGQGGTNICAALEKKLPDFMGSRVARGAKIKSKVLVTGGANQGSIVRDGTEWTTTERMKTILAQYAAAGIEVATLNGPHQHFVRINAMRSEDIAETLAKLAELSGRGARIPDGELNGILRITPPK